MSNPYDNPTSINSSVLGPTLKFEGELTAHENLLIQGEIKGSITHSSSLTIGKEGKLKADVNAEYISIEGRVDGELAGSKAVMVREGADVKGNIFSPTVTLREGATFNGSIDMSGNLPEPQQAAPEPKRNKNGKSGSAGRKGVDKISDEPKTDVTPTDEKAS